DAGSAVQRPATFPAPQVRILSGAFSEPRAYLVTPKEDSMNREQVADQAVQQDEASAQTSTTEQTYGLPAGLYAQVTRLGPGNVEGLKQLLARYPDFRQGILSVASHHLGAATVRQAIGAGPLTQDQI